MSPRCSAHYLSYLADRAIHENREFPHRCTPFVIDRPNRENLDFRISRRSVSFTLGTAWIATSTNILIMHVLFGCSIVKVKRIAARWIVALVANMASLWRHIAIGVEEGYAMRKSSLSFLWPLQHDVAMRLFARAIFAYRPWPTGIGANALIQMRPEVVFPFLWRKNSMTARPNQARIIRHCAPQLRDVAPNEFPLLGALTNFTLLGSP